MSVEKHNPIIIIDDDVEDLELIAEAFREIKVENELICFNSPDEALAFLISPPQQPLFILCDINMNSLSGLDLRKILYTDEIMRRKSIPFLFISASENLKDITNAYNLSVQGYFKKPDSFDGIVDMLKCIVEYWGYCQHPNIEGLRDDSLF